MMEKSRTLETVNEFNLNDKIGQTLTHMLHTLERLVLNPSAPQTPPPPPSTTV